MTPSERKALLFLAGVAVLGAGARVVTTPSRASSREERLALGAQIAAVDSARSQPRAKRARRARATTTRPVAPPPQTIVDLDVADAAAIEALPGIGPALARRVVDDRAANGPFGSLSGLERVRGVGPKLAAALREHVTFSGVSRPSPDGTRASRLGARDAPRL